MVNRSSKKKTEKDGIERDPLRILCIDLLPDHLSLFIVDMDRCDLLVPGHFLKVRIDQGKVIAEDRIGAHVSHNRSSPLHPGFKFPKKGRPDVHRERDHTYGLGNEKDQKDRSNKPGCYGFSEYHHIAVAI